MRLESAIEPKSHEHGADKTMELYLWERYEDNTRRVLFDGTVSLKLFEILQYQQESSI